MDKEKEFSQLYARLYPKMFRLCKGYFCGNESLALDAVQEIFMRIWENMDKFRGESRVTTWIYRIAVNVCLLHLRTAGRYRQIDVPKYIRLHSGEESARESRKIQALYKCIEKLDEVSRSIVIMMLEGVEYADIADILGIKEVSLRVRIHRIKKQLMKGMSDEEF